MKPAIFFLFAVFFLAAECTPTAYTSGRSGKRTSVSRSSVFFNKDGTNVAYTINHKPSGGHGTSVSVTRNVPVRPAVPIHAIKYAPAIIPRPAYVKSPVKVPIQLPSYSPARAPAVHATPVVMDAPVAHQVHPISAPVPSAVAYPVGVVQQAPIPLPYNTVPHNNAIDAYQMAEPFAFGPHPFAANYNAFFAEAY